MKSFFSKVFVMITIFLFLAVPFLGWAKVKGKVTPEKAPVLGNVMVTLYALGVDTSGQKPYGEAIYLSKGTPRQALITLKQIVLEGKIPAWSFNMKDQIEVVVFRGTFLKLSKIGIKKVVLKDSNVEIYAEYKDFPDSDFPTQPAAVISAGQLPPGKYTAILFVDNKLQKQVDFSVSR
jgi:hypothetical protein